MNKHLTQGERILALLTAAYPGEVSLPKILALSPHVAQYNARIKGLREAGYNIRCRTEHIAGEQHTFYRLVVLKSAAAVPRTDQAQKPTPSCADLSSTTAPATPSAASRPFESATAPLPAIGSETVGAAKHSAPGKTVEVPAAGDALFRFPTQDGKFRRAALHAQASADRRSPAPPPARLKTSQTELF